MLGSASTPLTASVAVSAADLGSSQLTRPNLHLALLFSESGVDIASAARLLRFTLAQLNGNVTAFDPSTSAASVAAVRVDGHRECQQSSSDEASLTAAVRQYAGNLARVIALRDGTLTLNALETMEAEANADDASSPHTVSPAAHVAATSATVISTNPTAANGSRSDTRENSPGKRRTGNDGSVKKGGGPRTGPSATAADHAARGGATGNGNRNSSTDDEARRQRLLEERLPDCEMVDLRVPNTDEDADWHAGADNETNSEQISKRTTAVAAATRMMAKMASATTTTASSGATVPVLFLYQLRDQAALLARAEATTAVDWQEALWRTVDPVVTEWRKHQQLHGIKTSPQLPPPALTDLSVVWVVASPLMLRACAATTAATVHGGPTEKNGHDGHAAEGTSGGSPLAADVAAGNPHPRSPSPTAAGSTAGPKKNCGSGQTSGTSAASATTFASTSAGGGQGVAAQPSTSSPQVVAPPQVWQRLLHPRLILYTNDASFTDATEPDGFTCFAQQVMAPSSPVNSPQQSPSPSRRSMTSPAASSVSSTAAPVAQGTQTAAAVGTRIDDEAYFFSGGGNRRQTPLSGGGGVTGGSSAGRGRGASSGRKASDNTSPGGGGGAAAASGGAINSNSSNHNGGSGNNVPSSDPVYLSQNAATEFMFLDPAHNPTLIDTALYTCTSFEAFVARAQRFFYQQRYVRQQRALAFPLTACAATIAPDPRGAPRLIASPVDATTAAAFLAAASPLEWLLAAEAQRPPSRRAFASYLTHRRASLAAYEHQWQMQVGQSSNGGSGYGGGGGSGGRSGASGRRANAFPGPGTGAGGRPCARGYAAGSNSSVPSLVRADAEVAAAAIARDALAAAVADATERQRKAARAGQPPFPIAQPVWHVERLRTRATSTSTTSSASTSSALLESPEYWAVICARAVAPLVTSLAVAVGAYSRWYGSQAVTPLPATAAPTTRGWCCQDDFTKAASLPVGGATGIVKTVTETLGVSPVMLRSRQLSMAPQTRRNSTTPIRSAAATAGFSSWSGLADAAVYHREKALVCGFAIATATQALISQAVATLSRRHPLRLVRPVDTKAPPASLRITVVRTQDAGALGNTTASATTAMHHSKTTVSSRSADSDHKRDAGVRRRGLFRSYVAAVSATIGDAVGTASVLPSAPSAAETLGAEPTKIMSPKPRYDALPVDHGCNRTRPYPFPQEMHWMAKQFARKGLGSIGTNSAAAAMRALEVACQEPGGGAPPAEALEEEEARLLAEVFGKKTVDMGDLLSRDSEGGTAASSGRGDGRKGNGELVSMPEASPFTAAATTAREGAMLAGGAEDDGRTAALAKFRAVRVADLLERHAALLSAASDVPLLLAGGARRLGGNSTGGGHVVGDENSGREGDAGISAAVPDARTEHLQQLLARSLTPREREHVLQRMLLAIVAEAGGLLTPDAEPSQHGSYSGGGFDSNRTSNSNGVGSNNGSGGWAGSVEEKVSPVTAASRMAAFCQRFGTHHTALLSLRADDMSSSATSHPAPRSSAAAASINGHGGLSASRTQPTFHQSLAAENVYPPGRAQQVWVCGLQSRGRVSQRLWLHPWRGTLSLEQYRGCLRWLAHADERAAAAAMLATATAAAEDSKGESDGEERSGHGANTHPLVSTAVSSPTPAKAAVAAAPSVLRGLPLSVRRELVRRCLARAAVALPVIGITPSNGKGNSGESSQHNSGVGSVSENRMGPLTPFQLPLHSLHLVAEGRQTCYPHANAIIEVATYAWGRLCRYVHEYEVTAALHYTVSDGETRSRNSATRSNDSSHAAEQSPTATAAATSTPPSANPVRQESKHLTVRYDDGLTVTVTVRAAEAAHNEGVSGTQGGISSSSSHRSNKRSGLCGSPDGRGAGIPSSSQHQASSSSFPSGAARARRSSALASEASPSAKEGLPLVVALTNNNSQGANSMRGSSVGAQRRAGGGGGGVNGKTVTTSDPPHRNDGKERGVDCKGRAALPFGATAQHAVPPLGPHGEVRLWATQRSTMLEIPSRRDAPAAQLQPVLRALALDVFVTTSLFTLTCTGDAMAATSAGVKNSTTCERRVTGELWPASSAHERNLNEGDGGRKQQQQPNQRGEAKNGLGGVVSMRYYASPSAPAAVCPQPEALRCAHSNNGPRTPLLTSTEIEVSRSVRTDTGTVERVFASGNAQLLFADGSVLTRFRPPRTANSNGVATERAAAAAVVQTLVIPSGRCFVCGGAPPSSDADSSKAGEPDEPAKSSGSGSHAKKDDSEHNVDPDASVIDASLFTPLTTRYARVESDDAASGGAGGCHVISREDGVCTALYTAPTVDDGATAASMCVRVVLHADGTCITTLPAATTADSLGAFTGGTNVRTTTAATRTIQPLLEDVLTLQRVVSGVPGALSSDRSGGGTSKPHQQTSSTLPPYAFPTTSSSSASTPTAASGVQPARARAEFIVRWCVESPRMPRMFFFALANTGAPDDSQTSGGQQPTALPLYVRFADGTGLLRRPLLLARPPDPSSARQSASPSSPPVWEWETSLSRPTHTTLRVYHQSALATLEPADVHARHVASQRRRLPAIAAGEGLAVFDLADGGLRFVDARQHVTRVSGLFDSRADAVADMTPTPVPWETLLRDYVDETYNPHRMPRAPTKPSTAANTNTTSSMLSSSPPPQRGSSFMLSLHEWPLMQRLRLLGEAFVVANGLLRPDTLRSFLRSEGERLVTSTWDCTPTTVAPRCFVQLASGEMRQFCGEGDIQHAIRVAEAESRLVAAAIAASFPSAEYGAEPAHLIVRSSVYGRVTAVDGSSGDETGRGPVKQRETRLQPVMATDANGPEQLFLYRALPAATAAMAMAATNASVAAAIATASVSGGVSSSGGIAGGGVCGDPSNPSSGSEGGSTLTRYVRARLARMAFIHSGTAPAAAISTSASTSATAQNARGVSSETGMGCGAQGLSSRWLPPMVQAPVLSALRALRNGNSNCSPAATSSSSASAATATPSAEAAAPGMGTGEASLAAACASRTVMETLRIFHRLQPVTPAVEGFVLADSVSRAARLRALCDYHATVTALPATSAGVAAAAMPRDEASRSATTDSHNTNTCAKDGSLEGAGESGAATDVAAVERAVRDAARAEQQRLRQLYYAMKEYPSESVRDT